MKTYITSDLHFGHTNIMKFCPATRGKFTDVIDMNERMILAWNHIVKPEDTVYILGDFAFLPANKATEISYRLNGNKILIEGNHDSKLIKDRKFRESFVDVHKYLRLVYNKTLVIMFHYPIYEWDQMHRGSVHFHGHLHGNFNGMPGSRALDVGYDSTGNIVSDMDEMINLALKGTIRNHHQTGV